MQKYLLTTFRYIEKLVKIGIFLYRVIFLTQINIFIIKLIKKKFYCKYVVHLVLTIFSKNAQKWLSTTCFQLHDNMEKFLKIAIFFL